MPSESESSGSRPRHQPQPAMSGRPPLAIRSQRQPSESESSLSSGSQSSISSFPESQPSVSGSKRQPTVATSERPSPRVVAEDQPSHAASERHSPRSRSQRRPSVSGSQPQSLVPVAEHRSSVAESLHQPSVAGSEHRRSVSESPSSSSEDTAFSKNNEKDTVEESTAQKLENYVRICPHQTLSFEKFQKIANNRDLQEGGQLEAFVKLPKHHHGFARPWRQCYVNNRSMAAHFVTTASIEHNSKHPKRPDGLMLFQDWTCAISGNFGYSAIRSKKALGQMLEKPSIWLCPHLNLGDSCFVNAAWEVLYPVGKPPKDRNEKYTAKHNKHPSMRCEDCDTYIDVFYAGALLGWLILFETRRYLGTGESLDDPIWRKQCALPQNEGGGYAAPFMNSFFHGHAVKAGMRHSDQEGRSILY